MTLTRFVSKNAFRNKRRSILTILSIGGSLLLLTFLITIWRSFYDSKPSEQSAQRLIVRHKVSLVFNLPSYYRQKIQAIPDVKEVVNEQWFGGQYMDDKPEHYFAQFGTDPQELLKVYPEFKIPADQLEAWQHDRAGAIVDVGLANKFHWKVGDRLEYYREDFPGQSGVDHPRNLHPAGSNAIDLLQQRLHRRRLSQAQRQWRVSSRFWPIRPMPFPGWRKPLTRSSATPTVPPRPRANTLSSWASLGCWATSRLSS